MRTPTTPMMKSVAVSASDSASTGRPPPSQHNRARDCNAKQHARQLECEQVVPEQWLGDSSHGVELLQLLGVEVARYDELLRKLRAGDYHDFAQESQPNQS